ncbi:hypothetical protein AKJ09_01773 [Labilithrix luteola]|uniref:BNR repeat domain protein n=1 Tax=Labilithrix luteola TaxID=1391654 RepID=A0A0K1PPR0_9BACT|nr:hypothetical protein [Labilithrix luteola]AKU95109.1 hypothetical protein AKJ09_01773 [Labilithrix luteola]
MIDLSRSGTTETFCALVAAEAEAAPAGRVACWGWNTGGELGRGKDAGEAPSGQPAFVPGIEDAASLGGSCVVLADGSVKCWGEGNFLQDGGALTTPSPVTLPLPPVRRIHGASDNSICALLTTGELTCLGAGVSYGRLPDGTFGPFAPTEPTVVTIPPGSRVVDVAADLSRFALLEGGVVLSWGSWSSLGRVSSLPLDPLPMPIALSNVSSIDAAGGHVCAVANGHVSCWGQGRHPDQSPPSQPIPEPVPGISAVVQVSVASTDSGRRGCAVTDQGDVYCWGANEQGQAGDGTRKFAFFPVKVVGLSGAAVLVRAARSSTCALLESGRVECWGDNTRGALGRGNLGPFELVPAPVKLP